MKRILIGLLLGGIVFGAVYALAASLTVTSAQLQAGFTDVAECDADDTVATSFTVSFSGSPAANRVTAVVVSGISSPECNGKTLDVELADGTGASVGNGTVAIDAVSESVPIDETPTASSVKSVHVVIR